MSIFLWVLLGLALIPTWMLTLEILLGILSRQRVAPGIIAFDKTCCVVIPAHNEEITLAKTLACINQQLGPNDRTLVIADNCSDATESIARTLANEVLVRTHATQKGKGYALAYALDHLTHNPPDVVVFLDADCTLEDEALGILKSAALEHNQPVQGHYSFSAPEGTSPVRHISEFATFVKNHIRMLGLQKMGGSVPITGSGFAVPFNIMQQFDLASGNIVEDMKLGIEMAINGVFVRYEPSAKIHSQLPTRDEDADKQRTRWEHGHLSIILNFTPKLFLAALRTGCRRKLVSALDMSIPPLSLLVAINALVLLVAGVYAIVAADYRLVWLPVISLLALIASLLATNLKSRHLGLASLPMVTHYLLGKIKIYNKLVSGEKSGWVKTKRDHQ